MKSVINSPYFLGLLTGCLIAISWPPFHNFPLLFICLVPLFWAWGKNLGFWQTFWSAWIAQFTFTFIGFHWIAFTAQEFGHFGGVASFFILLGYAAYSNFHFVIAALAARYCKKRWKLSFTEHVLCAALWIPFLEWIFPQIFPWNLGFPFFFSQSVVMHVAEWVGFWGLGLFVCLSSAMLTIALHYAVIVFGEKKRSRKKLGAALGIWFAGWVLIYSAGAFLGSQDSGPTHRLKVLTVQPNVGNFEKAFAERGQAYQGAITEDLLNETRAAIKQLGAKPDLVVWPETAYPASLDNEVGERPYIEKIKNFAREINAGILTGAYSDEPGHKNISFNAAFLYDAQGNLIGRYRKTKLLAFGEYIPGAKYFPWLRTLLPDVIDFNSGSGATTFLFGDIKIGVQICYEGLFAEFVRDISNMGAQIHINLTNDSWFGSKTEPVQHMTMTMSRSIETRRPVLRVTNTGVTTAYDLMGQELGRGPLNEKWAHLFEIDVPVEPKSTIYMKLVSFLPYLLLLGIWWIRKK